MPEANFTPIAETEAIPGFPLPELYSTYTPILQQYIHHRSKIGEALLLFRLGDFYECFFADAELLAKELEITLTSRPDSAHPGGRVPMAGIPFRTAESNIAKLLKQGHKIAICEQVGEVGSSKGPMQREIVRILTPGTLFESEYLEGENANYLAAIYRQAKSSEKGSLWGLAYVDISTAELKVTELSEQQLVSELQRIRPSEVLVLASSSCDADGIKLVNPDLPNSLKGHNLNLSIRSLHEFEQGRGVSKIQHYFGKHALEGFGCDSLSVGLSALGAVLGYLEFTCPDCLRALGSIQRYELTDFMKLDGNTLRNLELFETARNQSKKGSLIGFLEEGISTKMGSRALREWISCPLLSVSRIQARQAVVAQLIAEFSLRQSIQAQLQNMADLERLAIKLKASRLNPRELGWLKNSLQLIQPLKEALSAITLQSAYLQIRLSEGLINRITELETALFPELPVVLDEGNIIKLGYSPKLDELRTVLDRNEQWLKDYEQTERERTGIRSLKVSFNQVSGFFIEISKANTSLIPEDYQIKQNLTNASRCVTMALKEHESKYMQAQDSLLKVESEIFLYLRESIVNFADEISLVSRKLAELDCLLAFACLSAKHGYICPIINDSTVLKLENARHPVIEQVLPQGRFVGNDLYLASESAEQLMILTGPNMAGKSTFMRQTAILCILAQSGCFLPADRAEVGIVDAVLTRIGASDDLSAGQSTFMVEMIETAYLLNQMTARSLVLLDEIGRGTSTFDGVSIAWSVAEYLAERGSRAIFATHYHELNSLAEVIDGIVNCQVSVCEGAGELIFLHKVTPGTADKSYGIEVARMAGLPKKVLARAQAIMTQISAREVPAKRRSMIRESVHQAKLELGV